MPGNLAQLPRRKWTWFFRIATGKDHNWAATLKEIDSFDTEKDFWDMFHSAIKKPSELGLLRLPINYCIFRRSILPKWEDPANENGGTLNVEIKKTANAQQEPDLESIDFRLESYGLTRKLWSTLIEHVIKEQFGKYSEKINGVEFVLDPTKLRFGLVSGTVNALAFW
ncbi:eukaryotic translation initiation factor 4E-1-like [Artemia franciscana]|uniref:eukaryotic translation initiation factor 4E-1-like n=1 Tax=Artemia franciscana TaxID=6661 RepID=UPI0032DA581F